MNNQNIAELVHAILKFDESVKNVEPYENESTTRERVYELSRFIRVVLESEKTTLNYKEDEKVWKIEYLGKGIRMSWVTKNVSLFQCIVKTNQKVLGDE